MARNRLLKKEFFRDEKIGSIPLGARLLFQSLWIEADDAGNGRATLPLLKSAAFPHDNISTEEIAEWLRSLTERGLITLYRSNGESYYSVVRFNEHQKINRPSLFRYPLPPEQVSEDSVSTHVSLNEDSLTNVNVKENVKENVNVLPLHEDSMSIVKKISDSCLKILGIRVPYSFRELGNYDADAIKTAARVYGEAAVVADFESWASDHTGENIAFPISSYSKIMDARLRGIMLSEKNPENEQLGSRLYQIGNKVFTTEQIFKLLKNYSAQEIEQAYKEFIDGLDDFEMKSAVRNFVDGGAAAIILTQRKRKAESAVVEAVMADNRKEMERLAEEEIAKARAEEDAERSLADEEIDLGG